MQSSDRSLCRYVANITYCKMDRRFLNLEAIARWAPLEGETRSTLFASSWKNSFVRLECAVSFVSKGALHKAMVFYVSRRKHQKKKPVQRVQPNSRCCSRSCWTDHCVSQLCTLQSKLHRRAYWGFNANWSRVAKPPCNLPLNFSYDIFFGQCMFGRLHPILRSLG